MYLKFLKGLLGIATILLSISFSAQAALLTDGLVAHYSFDGDASDSSGNGNNATVYGAQLTEGRFNQAYLFDGQSDYIEAPHSSSLDITGPITLSAWIKSDGTYWQSEIISKMTSYSPAIGYQLYTQDDKARAALTYSVGATHNGTSVFSDTLVVDGTWHLLTMTYDGSEMRMYVGGQLEATIANSDGYESNTEPLQIGYYYYPYYDGQGGSNNWALNGAIDDVGIWNRALSQEEVGVVYANGIPEPATLSLLALGGLALMRKRRC